MAGRRFARAGVVLGGAGVVLAIAAWGPWGWGGSAGADAARFGAWLAALLLLFALGLRLPLQTRLRRPATVAYLVAVVLGALAVTVLANVGLYRHDVHFDLTRERVFSPSREVESLVRSLTRDVSLTYFYQALDPEGRRARDLVEVLGRRSPRLRVYTVDPDRQPAVADRYGIRLYNTAVLEAEGRRVQVQSTDEREIALGLLRVLRQRVKTLCFVEGHGEYSVDSFEFHTHFETLQAHTHGGQGSSVVLTERHGMGRMRRALESLGFEIRKVTLPVLKAIPLDCAAVVAANPRTTYLPDESKLLERYLARGGAALLMYDLGFEIEPGLAALLDRAGLALDQVVVVDPRDHYSTDPEIVAVPVYAPHPITGKIALTFYPGARPIRLAGPREGLQVTPLFTSSDESYTRPVRPVEHRSVSRATHRHGDQEAEHDHHRAPAPAGATVRRGRQVLAAAVEGRWPGAPAGSRPFRLVVVGDSDFASNSFFPYVANSDLALAMVRWLAGEEQTRVVKPRIPTLPTVVLTGRQMRDIFVAVEILLPLVVAVVGAAVWWRRR